MKQLLLSILMNIPFLLSAQLNHFLYFQTESKQPFYAKLDKTVFSSSASGYLIIPKLKDGIYKVAIGFPKTETGEQQYTCVVDKKDIGFLVKNFGDRGWGLFNLQTLDVVMSGSKPKDEVAFNQDKTDAFSAMLSDAVDDPAIRQLQKATVVVAPAEKPVSKAEPDLPKSEKITTETSTAVLTNTGASTINKKLINYGLDGVELVYIDSYNGQQDTVRILIPVEKEQPLASVAEPADSVKALIANTEDKKNETLSVTTGLPNNDEASVPVTVPVVESSGRSKPATKEEQFLPIEMTAQRSDSDQVMQSTTTPVAGVEPTLDLKPVMINSDCRDIATEDDFFKLRKKMVAATEDEKMMKVAGKLFKSKCFTTEQIKHLGGLFLTDAGKYHFFDMAYQFVTDGYNYSSLQNMLTDNYYITRFKAMVNR